MNATSDIRTPAAAHRFDPVARAAAIVRRFETPERRPVCRTFFDDATNTATHVVHDPCSGRAAIVDSVLDFDPASGRTGHAAASRIEAYVLEHRLGVDWILETHVHADHLSAAPWLQERLGGVIAISRGVAAVQERFAPLFAAGPELRDGFGFDRLFDDGDAFAVGEMEAVALQVPGHTPADMAFVVGDLVLAGDTLFMPDSGTARADFPGGDARSLYRSTRRLLGLPDQARLMLCHDYKGGDRRDFVWETTIGAQRAGNIHVRDGVAEDAFVAMRTARDAVLPLPRLMLPAVQVNMRGGRLPPPAPNGQRFLSIPLDAF